MLQYMALLRYRLATAVCTVAHSPDARYVPTLGSYLDT
jgi:hypothetical protein